MEHAAAPSPCPTATTPRVHSPEFLRGCRSLRTHREGSGGELAWTGPFPRLPSILLPSLADETRPLGFSTPHASRQAPAARSVQTRPAGRNLPPAQELDSDDRLASVAQPRAGENGRGGRAFLGSLSRRLWPRTRRSQAVLPGGHDPARLLAPRHAVGRPINTALLGGTWRRFTSLHHAITSMRRGRTYLLTLRDAGPKLTGTGGFE